VATAFRMIANSTSTMFDIACWTRGCLRLAAPPILLANSSVGWYAFGVAPGS